ncbi:MAG: LPS assembly lipoprotein LptE [Opitutaceae bacterium]|nr:LPS assembly lipoprotein LptE [Opitutaceae bacterium]
MRRLFTRYLLLASLLSLSGCASYQLGQPGNNGAYNSVYVTPIRNESTFPMLKSSLTASTRKAISDTGFLSIDSKDNADTILETRVVSVHRDIAAVSSIDVGRGRKYELEFVTLCTLYRKNGSQLEPVFTDRRILTKQDIFADSGQVNAEHQAGPEIARAIAQRIAETLVDTW